MTLAENVILIGIERIKSHRNRSLSEENLLAWVYFLVNSMLPPNFEIRPIKPDEIVEIS